MFSAAWTLGQLSRYHSGFWARMAICDRGPPLLCLQRMLVSTECAKCIVPIFNEGRIMRTTQKRKHLENLLPLADHVIKLEDRHAYQESARLAVHPVSVRDSAAIRSSLLSLTGPFMEDEICALLDNQIAMESSQPTPGQTPDENQQKNGSWSVYYYYSCAAGIWTSALFAAWILVSSFCGQFPSMRPFRHLL